MNIKIKVCIAIMLTIIFGVNVIAFANYENITINNNINSFENEFEYDGSTSGKFVGASVKRAEERKDIASLVIIGICFVVILYFFIKIIKFYYKNKKYKKLIKEGKEAEKPKIEINLKYILLLFIIIDILIWSIIILINLV